jgi:RPA family protein
LPIRLPAKKARIWDLVNGRFFPGNKTNMKPSFLITPLGEKISRANLIATVTEKFLNESENYGSLTLDDGTEAMRAKVFRENVKLLKEIEVGDLVLVIGKVKEYWGEIYLNAEIIRKIENLNYENFRKLEILRNFIERNKIVEDIRSVAEEADEKTAKKYAKEKYGMDEECVGLIVELKREIDYKPKILEIIESLDEGEGVEIGKLLETIKLPENVIEKAINELLNEGRIYEPKPNVLKKV